MIAICGSQGSGKTTVLSELQTLGFSTVVRKTSRSILQDWGVSLDSVNSNPTLTKKFQEEISLRKYNDERGIIKRLNNNSHIFTERTHADLFTYALISLGNNNAYSDWIDNYFESCRTRMEMYDHVFYITSGHFGVVSDGVRGTNKHYSKMVDAVMFDNTKRMLPAEKLTIITEKENRVSLILDTLNIPR